MAQNFHIAPLTTGKGKTSKSESTVQLANSLHQGVLDSRSGGQCKPSAQINAGERLDSPALRVGKDAVSNDFDGILDGAPKSKRVIVVGAGIAGLRAASVLKSNGVEVVILEGHPDRIGGRIYTKRRPNAAPRDIGKY